jgi:protein-tyrosine phosphatase
MLQMARLALIALVALPALAHSEITKLQCVQTGPAEYRISYVLTGGSHSVQISASPAPQGSQALQPILRTGKSEVTVHSGKPGERMYFLVKSNDGEQREVSIRHLTLEGTPNFRDLGGYKTSDGQYTRWGLIYRSGVLTYLTPADYTYLDQLHIHIVCDFRTDSENKVAPETWIPGSDVEQLHLAIGASNKNQSLSMQKLFAGNPTPEELRQRMMKVYGGLAFEGTPAFATLFDHVEHDPLPVLYHCTAGKDRTGLFSAFLLLTLGVPEKTVLADYALTNVYLQEGGQAAMKKMMHAAADPSFAHLSPADRAVLMAADPAYLQQTLRDIDSKYGSFTNYRRNALHISDTDVKILKHRLLSNE